MPLTSLEQSFNLARQHQQAGRFPEAEALYREVLRQNPTHADALHLLGVAAYQQGRNQDAATLIQQALTIKPNYPEALNHLSAALNALSNFEEAITAGRRAIALRPNFPGAYNNLGNALKNNSQLDDAIDAYRRAIADNPTFSEAYSNLGNALLEAQQVDDAIAAYRQAIALKSHSPGAYCNLSSALRTKGQLDQAIAAAHTAIQLQPNLAEAYSNLSVALHDRGLHDEAIAACRQAIIINANFAPAHHHLSISLRARGLLDDAIAAARNAITLNPKLAGAHLDLGNALKDAGQLDDAIAAYRQAVALAPANASIHSNLIIALHYHPASTAQSLAEEHRLWNQRHADPLKKFIRPHTNDRTPNRRLRIGYVSPDFWMHPVGRFLLPLLTHHDKSQFEVFIYANVLAPDDITKRFQSAADHWHNIVGIPDSQVADQIRRDQIDILIDPTMHTAQNRLLVFAHKPAPIQVSFLSYSSSTGMDAIDYRLSDPYFDPPSCIDESTYTERTLRLPHSLLCYQPLLPDPGINPLPALTNHFITFGCLNNFCKVSAPTLAAWIKILHALPTSRLLLYAHEGSHREKLRQRLAAEGIDPTRLQFVGHGGLHYLALYHQIDIALDTLPYCGVTTTCDALWMGVPVITQTGTTGVGRAGLSILTNAGLSQLVGKLQDEYVATACEMAQDLNRLNELRTTTRNKMNSSPLMDAVSYARALENALRLMWQEHAKNASQK